MSKSSNIIICTCDQLRAFEVGCYGNQYIQTPNIDRLAANGIRFETAVSSHPVCMAARSSILSGQYSRRCTGGISNFALMLKDGGGVLPEYPEMGRPHLKDITLPERLHSKGYHNAAIGKWHINSWPNDVGFDEYLIPRVHHCHTGQSFTRHGGPEFVPPGYSIDFEADEVADFLKSRSVEDSPFFLYYNISPPHCPIADAPEYYLSMYDPDKIPIRPNVDMNTELPMQDMWFKIYRYDFRHYYLHLPYADKLPDGYNLRNLIAEYYGLTTWVDDTVGRMMTSLYEIGLAENTIVVFTSDHGDMLGSHNRVQKGFLHEESIRIPYIIYVPGVDGSKVITAQTANLVDLMPTLLSLAGINQVEHTHGNDLSSVIYGNEASVNGGYSFIETEGDGIGVRTPTHIYGLPWSQTKGELGITPHYFYDLKVDPYQLSNMAGTDQQSDTVSYLDRILREWHAKTPWLNQKEVIK